MTASKHILLRVVMVAVWLMACGGHHAYAFTSTHFADSSKLATGYWVKIQVTRTGVHEITADDARNWGFSDLGRVHVFGMGGLPLSEKLTEDIPDDLPQLPVVRADGKLMFYAQGPTRWEEGTASLMLPLQHPYSTYAYYLLTDDSRFADVEPASASAAPQGTVRDTFVEHLVHEVDYVNPGETGRVYLGEDFISKAQQSFAFTLTGLVPGSEVKAYTAFGVKQATGTAKLTFQYNGINAPTSSGDQVSGGADENPYRLIRSTKSFTLDDDNELDYSVKFTTTGSPSVARLDYVAVNYTRQLALSNGQLCFDISHSTLDEQMRLTGVGETTVVWDVTEPWKPVALEYARDDASLSFSPIATGLRRYVAFNTSGSFARATLTSQVSNQNLHGLPTPDMVIITVGDYASQANRIAAMHEQVDSMRVLVVNEKELFNEFSGGIPDAMAYRMLCKMFYDRGEQDGHKLGYLLLLGKGTFDNRLITSTIKALNAPMLLTWQSDISDNHSNSYTTDDFFGTLSDESGPNIEASRLDIAVGRMTVKSVAEAKNVVDKLISHVTTPDYGWWKNNVLNVADDGNEGIHMEQAESVITAMRANGGDDFVYNRVYLDAFTGVSNGAKRTYPDANTKHYNTLRNGVVWWNYTGHSGPHAMTDNGLLRHADLDTKFYYKHLPVLYAATCDFNQFDGTEESGGETLFLNPRGGVIALVCPPRPVYVSQNGTLNANVGKYVFARDEDNLPMRLGDILRLGKNDSPNDRNKLRYFLVGDPAMRINYPANKVKVESIDGAREFTSTGMPVFHGRQTMTIKGIVTDYAGNPLPNFNGSLTTELYDYEQSITTHGYGDESDGSDGKKFTYLDRTNKLAVSIDSVTAGRFTVRIVLPTEVLPRPNANGDSVLYDNFSPSWLNLYAYSANDSIEAMGSNDDFIIYGYDDTVENDSIGPTIHFLGLNSENFVNGDQVNESPLVIASISDDYGINYSSAGIGHSMSLTLDGGTTFGNVIDYFTPRPVADGTSGTLSYALSDLAEGPHTLKLRVWDVFNNSTESSIDFVVVKGMKPEIYDVYSTNNPASVETTFYVKHNRPDALLTVGIEVYDLMGRLVWSSKQSGVSDTYTSFPVTWDLTDRGGRRVPRGIYVYRAIISTDGVQEATKSKKLAVTSY